MIDFSMKDCIDPLRRAETYFAVFLAIFVGVLSAPSSVADQVRTYEFIVGDEFNYSSDCGACPLVFGTRARVELDALRASNRKGGQVVTEPLEYRQRTE
jgi:hypothetical protein